MQLTPVQRYAMNFLESIQEEFSLEQLKQAEVNIKTSVGFTNVEDSFLGIEL